MNYFAFLIYFALLSQAIAQTNVTGIEAGPVPDAWSAILTQFLIFVGACRLLVKPIFSVLHAMVKTTPTQSDDAMLEKVESSKVMKAFLFLLDWFLSVKIVKK